LTEWQLEAVMRDQQHMTLRLAMAFQTGVGNVIARPSQVRALRVERDRLRETVADLNEKVRWLEAGERMGDPAP